MWSGLEKLQYYYTPYINIKHHTTQCNIIQHHTTPYNTIQHHTISYNTIQYHTTPYNIIQHHTKPYNTIQHNTKPYNTIQRCKILQSYHYTKLETHHKVDDIITSNTHTWVLWLKSTQFFLIDLKKMNSKKNIICHHIWHQEQLIYQKGLISYYERDDVDVLCRLV